MGSSLNNCRTISVQLSANPYPIVIGEGSLGQLGQQVAAQGLKPGTKVLVVTNPVVNAHYGETALASLDAAGFVSQLLVIEAGEEQKNPATVAWIYNAAFEHKLERGSLIVALGGGVVGDMAGFAAASWLRGIAVAVVPITRDCVKLIQFTFPGCEPPFQGLQIDQHLL